MINVTKYMQDFYAENYKTDDRNKRRSKLVEQWTVVVDWKNEYCQNVISYQIDKTV